MNMQTWPRQKRILILLGVAVLAVVGMFMVPPIAQDLAYHNFVDPRRLWGIPNFGDVISNLPFAIVGLAGLRLLHHTRRLFDDRAAFHLWVVFFIGVFLVAFGSGYYHWAPDNHTLVWDRIPMTIAFMSLFCLIVLRHIDRQAGIKLFVPLLLAGIGSVFYWDYTESIGQGDLRPYALVQFLPMVLIPLILWLFPATNAGVRYLLWTLGFYMFAKVLEHFDAGFFHILGDTVSGHSLKHVSAAVAVGCLLPYVRLFARRDIVAGL